MIRNGEERCRCSWRSVRSGDNLVRSHLSQVVDVSVVKFLVASGWGGDTC